MKRDDDGLLTYTKVNWYSGDTINVNNGEGTQLCWFISNK